MNRVYKLTPVSPYDIAGVESWLADMARRGLYLKKFRSLFCTFTKAEPKQIRYRVEPHKRILDDDLPQSMLDLYGDFGWECVDEIDRSMLIFATQDPQAPELHSDPELQWEQWNKLRKSVKRSCWVSVLTVLFALGLLLWMLFGDGQPLHTLLTTSAPVLLLFLVYEMVILPSSFADARRLDQIARQLKAGLELDHRTVYPPRRPGAVISFSLAVVLFILLILGEYVFPLLGEGPGVHLRSVQPLSELTDFPCLSLEALEGEGYQAHHFTMDGVDYSNFCDRERSLLCWNQWEVVQTGNRGPDGMWVRLNIQWYDLSAGPLSKALAPALAREQLDKALGLNERIWWRSADATDWVIRYLDLEGVDYLAIAHQTGSQFQAAAVAVGDKAAVVQYTGHGDLDQFENEIVAMVTEG